jgi:hypothetical protein
LGFCGVFTSLASLVLVIHYSVQELLKKFVSRSEILSSFFGGELYVVNLGDLNRSVYQTGHLKVFTRFELGMPQASESFWMGTEENVRDVPEFILGAPALVLMTTGRSKLADHS